MSNGHPFLEYVCEGLTPPVTQRKRPELTEVCGKRKCWMSRVRQARALGVVWVLVNAYYR